MTRRSIVSVFAIMISALLVNGLATGLALAQTPPPAAKAQAAPPAKPIKRDEVYFSMARRISEANESQVSAVVTELDGIIEVTEINYHADGKAEVTVKERAPSNASSTNKSIRLIFAPPAAGDKWTWEQFEDNRRFYATEKIFAYAKAELGRRKQNTTATWNGFLTAMVKQGEAANKVLETAKAILKGDPPPLAAVTAARTAMAEAMKENKYEEIITAYNNLAGQTEAITTLGDTYSDLKANDAYLRLLEEFKNSVNVTNATRKNYVQAVDLYNEALVRMPFGLVAYGLEFTKIEPKVTAD